MDHTHVHRLFGHPHQRIHTGLKVSHLYIFQAKQEYGTIERGLHLAEIQKRQVALMPYLRSKSKHKGTERLRDELTKNKRTSI